ncbi:hypothetical protein BD413DRAFT_615819 [Trametes elegans]|nr:hypothetical protein BD413DRAFT_615819 [Trametes elegans]
MPPVRKPRRFLASDSFYDKSGAIADGRSPPPSPTTPTAPYSSRTRLDARDWDWDGARNGSGSGHGSVGMDEDDEYTLTGYGELSAEAAFTLPPSPTQTIKYRYRAYRPKLARGLRKLRSSASRGPASTLKTKAGGYHSEYASLLNAYLSGTPGRGSSKRDFQALLQKYRESSGASIDAGNSSGGRGGDPYTTPRKGGGGSSVRRTGSTLSAR